MIEAAGAHGKDAAPADVLLVPGRLDRQGEVLFRLSSLDPVEEVGRMAVQEIAHPSIDERKAKGQEARDRAAVEPLRSGARPQTARTRSRCWRSRTLTREPDLVPVRHGRMMVSPFTFYRGAAKIMAADLKDTPVAGLSAQLCGDAHLSNFGAFASPERRLLFDLNDFDETLPGPFEYDVKRMAASFTIAARNNGFSAADTRAATLASVRAYREAMADVRADADDGHLVRPPGRGRAMAGIRTAVAGTAKQAKAAKREGGQQAKAPKKAENGRQKQERRRTGSRRRRRRRRRSGRRRPWRRRTPATACRRCPSSASWSTATTGSSASRRSSSRCATWPPPTGCPPRGRAR